MLESIVNHCSRISLGHTLGHALGHVLGHVLGNALGHALGHVYRLKRVNRSRTIEKKWEKEYMQDLLIGISKEWNNWNDMEIIKQLILNDYSVNQRK